MTWPLEWDFTAKWICMFCQFYIFLQHRYGLSSALLQPLEICRTKFINIHRLPVCPNFAWQRPVNGCSGVVRHKLHETIKGLWIHEVIKLCYPLDMQEITIEFFGNFSKARIRWGTHLDNCSPASSLEEHLLRRFVLGNWEHSLTCPVSPLTIMLIHV